MKLNLLRLKYASHKITQGTRLNFNVSNLTEGRLKNKYLNQMPKTSILIPMYLIFFQVSEAEQGG